MLVSAKSMLEKAKAGKYAVGQFNINNLEWTKAILLTAQELNSPVILGVSEGAGKYMCGYKTVVGMVNGMLDLVPSAKVGHIGMYRDEETMIPHPYYCKLPADIDKRLIVVVDPMLATGGSAIDAITQIKEKGGKQIKFLCLIAAPEGIDALAKAHPDVQIYCANVDECLNEHCYIVPGLGDAGDRIFGTK